MNVLRNYLQQTSRRCLGTTSMSNASSSSTSLPSSIPNAIEQLRAQTSHYVIASLMGKRYLLAPRDLLTVPRLRTARVGDRLFLSHIHEVGSRDYTLRGHNEGQGVLPKGVVRVEATVVEHTKGAMERIVKFKRRKHYQKTVTHKQPYTRLRIGPIQFGRVEEEGEHETMQRLCS